MPVGRPTGAPHACANSFDKVNKTIKQGGAELVQRPASKLKNQAGGKLGKGQVKRGDTNTSTDTNTNTDIDTDTNTNNDTNTDTDGNTTHN